MNSKADSNRSLLQERAALQHELRRVNDALERNRTVELQQQARRLADAIALCDLDLARTTASGGSG